MNLAEKYRPNSLDGIIGQEKAVKILSRLDYGGRAFWIAGASGTGKTTLARIIADSTNAENTDITEIVARQLSPLGLKDITRNWIFVGGHVLIVNEAHGLSRPMIEIFLDVLENLKPSVTVIFTTTCNGQDLFEEQLDSSPFNSRCISIRLAQRNLCQPFARRCKEIAGLEGLDGKPIEAYEKLLKTCRNNFRKALMEIEGGAMLKSPGQ